MRVEVTELDVFTAAGTVKTSVSCWPPVDTCKDLSYLFYTEEGHTRNPATLSRQHFSYLEANVIS